MIWRTITLMFIAIIGGWVGFKVSDRDIPTVVFDAKANPPVASPGQTIRIESNATRARACEIHVERLLFDASNRRHVLTDLDFAYGVLPVGPDRYSVPLTIPDTASAGKATYRTINCYVCNWTHRIAPICDTPRDTPFEIR